MRRKLVNAVLMAGLGLLPILLACGRVGQTVQGGVSGGVGAVLGRVQQAADCARWHTGIPGEIPGESGFGEFLGHLVRSLPRRDSLADRIPTEVRLEGFGDCRSGHG